MLLGFPETCWLPVIAMYMFERRGLVPTWIDPSGDDLEFRCS